MRNDLTRKLIVQAMLIALSIVLVLLIRIPIFPSAPFLEYDMADVPILVGAFMFGPATGLALTAIVSVLQWLFVSVQSGWVGALMHFLATGAFVLVSSGLYREKRTQKRSAIALTLGAATMVLMMIPLNIIFSSYYYMALPLNHSFNSYLTVLTAMPHGFGALIELLICSIGVVIFVERMFKSKASLALKACSIPIALLLVMLIITPANLLFGSYSVPDEAQSVISMLLPIFVPFNAIKAFGNGIIVFLLFNKLLPVINRGNYFKESPV